MEKKRILIIDDEASFTRMVKLNLEKTGAFEVREENRAAYALTAAREFKPDVILLDVIMPTMDGGDVAAHIRNDRNLKNTPIIFLTATVSQREAGQAGFNAEAKVCAEERRGGCPWFNLLGDSGNDRMIG